MSGYGKTFEAIHRAGQVLFNARYQPWGRLRRRNLMSKFAHIALMTVLGLGAMAAVAVLLVFAASVAVIAVLGLGIATLLAVFTRKPLKVVVRAHATRKASKSRAEGSRATGGANTDDLFEARKEGNTWVAYK